MTKSERIVFAACMAVVLILVSAVLILSLRGKILNPSIVVIEEPVTFPGIAAAGLTIVSIVLFTIVGIMIMREKE